MMELKIPPAIIFLACGGIMWGIDYYMAGGWLNFLQLYWLTALCFLFGGIIALLGLIEFFRHRTSVDPHKPEKTTALVTSGIYRITRNPMYLGLLFWLAAFGFYLGNILSFLVLPLFVGYLTRYQIKPEEQILRRKYGDAYSNYQSRVRRWL